MYASAKRRGANCTRVIYLFQAEDCIRDYKVTGVQTCALPILIYKPMKKIIKLSFGSFVVVALLGFIFLISSVENEKESFFSSYDLLGEDGQRYISWVPVFLPKTAFNIRIYADVETNYFYMF